MKKTYINPTINVIVFSNRNTLLAGSGVDNDSPLGHGYNSEDKTYARRFAFDEGEDY